ncbi:MAG: heparinase II/III family protein [Planctomycetota bacterium]|nr:heparinase II/III family protein [Planctomycetota bacterium]
MSTDPRTCSDADFVRLFDLSHPDLSDARAASSKKDDAAAAKAILDSLGRRPLRAYLGQQEAAELGRQIAADDPSAVATVRAYVDAMDAGKHGAGHSALASREAYLHAVDIDHDAHTAVRRGRAWYYFGMLQALTGDAQWAARAAKLLESQDAFDVDLRAQPDDAFVPLLGWHPNWIGGNALDQAHIVQNMGIVLPMLWPAWDAAARRASVAYLAHEAECFFRGYREDPLYNIPFHGLVAMYGVAALFPQLAGAAKWRAYFEKLVGPGSPVTTPWIMVQDGYFGEGLGYQQVNTFLLTRSLLIGDRGFETGRASDALRHEVEMGFKLAAETLRPDGNAFTIGDHSGRSAHEHEIEYHEVLHLGAALFDRPAWKARAGGVRGDVPPPLSRFLMGRDGYARWKKMPAPDAAARVHASTAHPAGFFNLRAGKGVEDACHGLLNVSVASNHGHHDVNTVCIYGLGRELISDSGRLAYTPEGNALQQAPNAHAALRLGHLLPRGPRHATTKAVTRKLFAQSPDGRVQAAVGEHRLIEDHVHRRALVLLLPHGPEKGEGVWLVWDRLSHADTADGREPAVGSVFPAPQRVLETTFPLHALGGEAKTKGLTAWSCHTPQDRLRARNAKEALTLTSADAAFVHEAGESDANIQVSALPGLQPGASLDCSVVEGFVALTDLTAVRPVLSFQSRAFIPFESTFALLPFRGVAGEAPWSAEGGWSGKDGAFEAVLKAQAGSLRPRWKDPVTVRAEGLHGGPGAVARIVLALPGGTESVVEIRL